MKLYKIAFALLLIPTLISCSIESFDQRDNLLTDAESIIAGQILGESVSENQEGLLSSFEEAFAVPTQTNLIKGPSLLSTGSFRHLDQYSYRFNVATGEHLVSFTRQSLNEFFSSETSYELTYKFYDSSENLIEDPVQRIEDIESVEFFASRTGNIQGETKQSNYTRTDRLFINGISNLSETLMVDGFHSGEGVFARQRLDGSSVTREYLLDINYLDIRINKELVQRNRNFRKGVTGALSYESNIREINQANTEAKVINGTIELTGDGTALLKFREQFTNFRLRLASGELFDEDEFEGRVTSIDLASGIFTISNGQRIQINNDTEIEYGDDFINLNEVSLAIQQAVRITAEGDYFQPDEEVNLWIATEVEFELESNEFEDLIDEFNLIEKSFTLINGDKFFYTESTDFDFGDGLSNLEDVNSAVQNRLPVEVKGDFFIDHETGLRIVKDADFEFDFDEFEDTVTDVNLVNQTFTLENGRTVLVTEDTIIAEGDFNSLEEVQEALDENITVIAVGDYYFNDSLGRWIAINVEFED